MAWASTWSLCSLWVHMIMKDTYKLLFISNFEIKVNYCNKKKKKHTILFQTVDVLVMIELWPSPCFMTASMIQKFTKLVNTHNFLLEYRCLWCPKTTALRVGSHISQVTPWDGLQGFEMTLWPNKTISVHFNHICQTCWLLNNMNVHCYPSLLWCFLILCSSIVMNKVIKLFEV